MTPANDTLACPLEITPQCAGQTLADWAQERRDGLEALLIEHKALLFRGFAHSGGLETISPAFFDSRIAYTYRSTPRTSLGQDVFTATEYPRKLWIAQHCENAYQLVWPLKLLFHCVEPATSGGRTPLADTIRVTEAIDPAVKEEFARRRVKYVRNYRPGVDLPWEEVFGTSNRAAVEQFCRANRIAFEWTDGGLRTSQVCHAFASHPVTRERVWFNQAHLFHVSTLEAPAQAMMLSMFGEQGLPRNSYFGDGGAIPAPVLEHIRAAYGSQLIFFDWKHADVLLIDNMLVSHGREPYEGPRKVHVCMSQAYSPSGVHVTDVDEAELVKSHV